MPLTLTLDERANIAICHIVAAGFMMIDWRGTLVVLVSATGGGVAAIVCLAIAIRIALLHEALERRWRAAWLRAA